MITLACMDYATAMKVIDAKQEIGGNPFHSRQIESPAGSEIEMI